MDAVPDFEDLLVLFQRHDVRYLVIGGLAFIYHARPRYTKDMDLADRILLFRAAAMITPRRGCGPRTWAGRPGLGWPGVPARCLPGPGGVSAGPDMAVKGKGLVTWPGAGDRRGAREPTAPG